MIATLALVAQLTLAQEAEPPPTELSEQDLMEQVLAEMPPADPALVERFATAFRADAEDIPEEKLQAFATFLARMEQSFPYQEGLITLGDGLATVDTQGLRYLPPSATADVIEFWGNPPGAETLGMLVPPEGPLMPNSWAVVLRFDDSGWVDDSDAASIDYDDLLVDMKKSTEAESAQRVQMGLDPMKLVGWAEPPHYESSSKVMYWAKAFDSGSLNYDVRALGRRGVLSMVAVASVDQLGEIRDGMEKIRGTVSFKEGHRYEDYDPSVDKAAGYGLATLVAGGAVAGVALKSGAAKGIFALLLAGKKFIVVGVIAAGAALKNLFNGGASDPEANA